MFCGSAARRSYKPNMHSSSASRSCAARGSTQTRAALCLVHAKHSLPVLGQQQTCMPVIRAHAVCSIVLALDPAFGAGQCSPVSKQLRRGPDQRCCAGRWPPLHTAPARTASPATPVHRHSSPHCGSGWRSGPTWWRPACAVCRCDAAHALSELDNADLVRYVHTLVNLHLGAHGKQLASPGHELLQGVCCGLEAEGTRALVHALPKDSWLTAAYEARMQATVGHDVRMVGGWRALGAPWQATGAREAWAACKLF